MNPYWRALAALVGDLLRLRRGPQDVPHSPAVLLLALIPYALLGCGVLECRFVTLKPTSNNLWTQGIEKLNCPVSHGEGNFFCQSDTLENLKTKNMITFKYCHRDMSPANGEYPDNPNGSIEDIAGITSEDGKVLGVNATSGTGNEFY